MTNIELKARCADFVSLEEQLNDMGAGMAGVYEQTNTYFRVPRGRLKLRQPGPDDGQLIQYSRDDVVGPKRSDYRIAHTSDPAAIRMMLAEVLGAWLEVRKTRQIWCRYYTAIWLPLCRHEPGSAWRWSLPQLTAEPRCSNGAVRISWV